MNNIKHTRAMLAIALLGAFAAQSAFASCKVPTTPRSMPDGQRASTEAMVEAKREVDTYLQEVSDYFACEKDGRRLQEVIARQKLVMASFNAEVRAYNSRARAYQAVNRK